MRKFEVSSYSSASDCAREKRNRSLSVQIGLHVPKVRLENAQEDLEWPRGHDRTSFIKWFDLVRGIMNEPRGGTGNPERPRYLEFEVVGGCCP